MIPLAPLAIALSTGGILVTGMLAVIFLRDPVKGLVQTTHRLAELPKVMADRYVAFTALALGATVYRDLKVIAFLFAVFAFMAFADAWIYAWQGHATSKHLTAGFAAALVCVVALAALSQTGAAS